MPGGDRTGPMGQGPMTGRAGGYCTGATSPGFMSPAPRRGFWSQGGGRGGAAGRGWRNRYYSTCWGFSPYAIYGDPSDSSTPREEEMEILRKQADYLSETLEDLKKRIEALRMQKREG